MLEIEYQREQRGQFSDEYIQLSLDSFHYQKLSVLLIFTYFCAIFEKIAFFDFVAIVQSRNCYAKKLNLVDSSHIEGMSGEDQLTQVHHSP